MTRFSPSVSSFDWQPFLKLYLGASLTYYLATWWGYRQYDDSLPIWNVEEFFASSGLKFGIYLIVSVFLLGSRSYVLWLRPWLQAVVALIVFTSATSILQEVILGHFGYVQFFGDKLSVFNYLITVSFFALQGLVFLWVRDRNWRPAIVHKPEQPRVLRAPAREVQGWFEEQAVIPDSPIIVFGSRGKTRVPLRPTEISHIIACRNYATAHNSDGSYLLDFGIGEAEKRIGSMGFMRVHRSYLVNMAHLKQIEREGRSHRLVMSGNERIPVGVKYLKELRALGY